jgi:hypothetical protein
MDENPERVAAKKVGEQSVHRDFDRQRDRPHDGTPGGPDPQPDRGEQVNQKQGRRTGAPGRSEIGEGPPVRRDAEDLAGAGEAGEKEQQRDDAHIDKGERHARARILDGTAERVAHIAVHRAIRIRRKA